MPRTADPALMTSLTIATRFPAEPAAKNRWNAVLDRKERVRRPVGLRHESLRVVELDAQIGGDHQRHEGTFDERTADRVHAMSAEARRQGGRALADELGAQAEQLEIGPQIAVMPGLEPEVADPAGQLADQLFLFEERAHRRIVGAARRVPDRAGKLVDGFPRGAARRQPAGERHVRLRERGVNRRVAILAGRVDVRSRVYQLPGRLIVSSPDRGVQRRVAVAGARQRSHRSGVQTRRARRTGASGSHEGSWSGSLAMTSRTRRRCWSPCPWASVPLMVTVIVLPSLETARW